MGIIEKIETANPENGDLLLITVRNFNDKKRVPMLMAACETLRKKWLEQGKDVAIFVVDGHVKWQQMGREDLEALVEAMGYVKVPAEPVEPTPPADQPTPREDPTPSPPAPNTGAIDA